MAKFDPSATDTFAVDVSDARAIVAAAQDLQSRLEWPEREEFASKLDDLIKRKAAVNVYQQPKGKGAPLIVEASPELLDLMRAYEPVRF